MTIPPSCMRLATRAWNGLPGRTGMRIDPRCVDIPCVMGSVCGRAGTRKEAGSYLFFLFFSFNFFAIPQFQFQCWTLFFYRFWTSVGVSLSLASFVAVLLFNFLKRKICSNLLGLVPRAAWLARRQPLVHFQWS
ncbi:hypothetical protein BDY21DRAFT_358908 [Lineolata rhizophorae]|uniref:Uncharacterized protein n=1 Tax=Lineolata rhizophorae TaxID=578093 RepID=A0A6A6NLP2_9PEZI|nr:hypothetical protein BDY21DRAFT_358908 [Lineolata rhizophorae]